MPLLGNYPFLSLYPMKCFGNIFILCLFVLMGCSSSSDDPTQDTFIELSVESIPVSSDGGQESVRVKANTTWSIVDDGQTWYQLSSKTGYSGEAIVKIEVSKNQEERERSAVLTFQAGEVSKELRLTQEKTVIPNYVPKGYTLVWKDEFNEGTRLNAEHWTYEVQNSGWVNNELQNYVNGEYNGKRVTELSDGKLYIHCFKADGKIYSGRVYAHVNEGWQYGYIEARLMLPKGKGTWPAFWMMPVEVDWANEGWPKCGEIDIMEEVGVVPNEVSSSLHAEGHNHTNGTQVTKAVKIDKAEGEFHTYALEWTAENITTYVDGKVLLSYDNDGTGVRNWPYDKPYYIILNLAWGGSWGGMNGVDESALPVSYVIDYVRVYQKK